MVTQEVNPGKDEGLATEELLCLLHEPVARIEATCFDIDSIHYHEMAVQYGE